MNPKPDAGDNADPTKPLSEKSRVTVQTTVITVVGSVLVAGFTTFGAIYATRSSLAKASEGASTLNRELTDAMAKQGGISVPPGTILAYGGPISDESRSDLKSRGWLLCDGAEVSQTSYPDLWRAIGLTWGTGDRARTFNLPDLRGVFLRGMNGGRDGKSGDPDATNRTSLARGGSRGNNVGSFQGDALQNVRGTIGNFNCFGALKGTTGGPFVRSDQVPRDQGVKSGTGGGNMDPYAQIAMDLSRDTSLRTSRETRPKNVYVNYIVKY